MTEELQKPVDGGMNKKIFRATGILMIIQVVMKFFGLIVNKIMSKFWGTDINADAYNAAKDIAFYLFQFVDQIIMHSFLPVFVQKMKDEGEEKAWKLASTAINLLVILMLVITAVGIAFSRQLLPMFLPDWFDPTSGKSEELINLTVKLTQMMLVAIIFLGASSMTYVLLNSYKKFALPAAADMALKATVLVFAVVFAKHYGPAAFAAGFIFGAAAKLIIHSIGLGKRVTHYRPTLDLKDPALKKFLILALPLAIGTAASIFRSVFDQRFISGLEIGSYSAIKYAKTLCDMPVQFFPFVFGIALFPFIADLAADDNREKLKTMLMSATRMMILIFVPLAISFILLRGQILNGIYGSEKFDEASIALTTGPFIVISMGMLIGALEIIILQFYFAMSDTLRPNIISVCLVPVHIGIAYVGIKYLGLGAAAIPLALLINKGTKISILYADAKHKFGSLGAQDIMIFIGKTLAALLPLAILLYMSTIYLPGILPNAQDVDGDLKKILTLIPYIGVMFIGSAIYVALLHIMKVSEVTMLLQKVAGKLLKKK
jgi:putative peptidoglycan lipid II flippase